MAKIKKGIKLCEALVKSGTGKAKLDVIYGFFKWDRKKTKILEDIPAAELLEMIEEQSDEIIPPTTKEKARSFHETGAWTPPPMESSYEAAQKYLEVELAFPVDDDEDEEEDDTPPPPKKKAGRPPKVKPEAEPVA